MKKIAVLVLFFISIFYFSQEKTERYIYEVTINPDTVNLVKMKSEIVFLDVKKNSSLFMSENFIKKDSLKQLRAESKSPEKEFKQDKSAAVFFPSYFNFLIQKEYNTHKEIFFERIGPNLFYYTENRPLKWEITKEKDGALQKAVTNFGGRIWTAWFNPEIKISDGPYKFEGLPGLITKIEDSKGDYKFNLIRKEIVTTNYDLSLSEAQETTLENLSAQKITFELNKNKGSRNFNENPGYRNGGGMGGMGRGGAGGGRMNGGMMHNGMNGNNNSFPTNQNNENFSGFSQNINHNPIELKN
jgi:GLPGLI family protein